MPSPMRDHGLALGGGAGVVEAEDAGVGADRDAGGVEAGADA